MTKLTPLRIPEAVMEDSDSSGRRYWLRQQSGNYSPLPEPDFRLHAIDLHGRAAAKQLRFKATLQPVSIRYLAGVLPAVYQGDHDEFLVPEFIPIGRIPAADDPPAEFKRLFKLRRSLMEGGRGSSDEARKAEKRMKEIYREVRLLQPLPCGRSVAINHPWRVLGMNYRSESFPCDDHTEGFRLVRYAGCKGSEGVIWTSQPYGYDAAEILGFAHQYKLTVTVSPNWGWDYPGHAPLIEWSRPGMPIGNLD